jgi:hypothetical protein
MIHHGRNFLLNNCANELPSFNNSEQTPCDGVVHVPFPIHRDCLIIKGIRSLQ